MDVNEVWWELGSRWSRADLEALLARVSELDVPGERVLALARALAGTPFHYESMLSIPPPGCLRVRLESLDCATLVYNVLAMAYSPTPTDLVHHLARLRYQHDVGRPIDSDPTDGNILGFSSECLLGQAAELGYLKDVTADVAGGPEGLTELELELRACRRPREHDPDERLEKPRFGDGLRRARFLARAAFPSARWEQVRSGDLIAFTRGPRLKDGSANTDFVNHLAIAEQTGGTPGFIHATRHFAWNPHATPDAPVRWTGIFYGTGRQREQIGVGPGGVYAGDSTALDVEGSRLHGYEMDRPRPLRDFAEGIFAGIFVLRPIPLPARPAPTARRDGTA
ncbi:N-acetylmuramoyl-L-alanine amidase-like domain-containing protein [Pyxidicoccus trucidator]|uniref:N-acetylmuramoyl-L-alanine amidase-like domain-containing protein n=1 Tax=Pyxidicoccus trucidator TaxID=2709662 RepID=UPI0013D9BAD6|nr:N-acetylmuramoyl-L-alanine amidase-like domain-containing protein [Pyxidicoccus trucidator]